MVAATQTTRFLPFLDSAEESALLAAAPTKTVERGQLVLDQNVQLRAIFLMALSDHRQRSRLEELV